MKVNELISMWLNRNESNMVNAMRTPTIKSNYDFGIDNIIDFHFTIDNFIFSCFCNENESKRRHSKLNSITTHFFILPLTI